MKKFTICFIIYFCVISFSKIAASEKGTFIKEIQVKSQARTLEIELIANGPISDYRSFTTDKPTRLIIDTSLSDCKIPKVYPLNNPSYSQIRWGINKGKLRLVIDSNLKQIPPYEISTQNNILKVVLDSEKTLSPVTPVKKAEKVEKLEQGGFLLGPEDILEISVWKDETLTKQVVVRPDGKISFPLIGEIQAAGRTVEDLRKEIIEKLSEFISDPVVTVMVIGINSYKIYVIGKVNKPGAYTVGRSVNVMQALSMAGGFSPFADLEHISILREQNGKQIRIKFNYKEVAKGKHLEENILLKRGDVIVVP
ncbi:MAG TPA: AMIN domain-containing protein [Candidatus Desulfofervidus auxilii]|uniref:AMIN domain-containing protein n=2 Tax=Desulfofervidus auxilii TaxID=1621989 RepID=A0A7V1I4W9_DESA2|nr:AMIN domain-containing protein [Candidatus Desulfofervidus auxilii]